MFYNYSNLDILIFILINEIKNKNLSNMFENTPEDLAYCIYDKSRASNILSLLEIKKCTFNDSLFNWKENKQNRLEEKKITLKLVMMNV